MIEIGQLNDSYNASVVRCQILTLKCEYRRAQSGHRRRKLQRMIDKLTAALVHYHLTK